MIAATETRQRRHLQILPERPDLGWSRHHALLAASKGRFYRLLHLFVWFIFAISPCGVVSAHEDTLIQHKRTSLVGLPQEYAPAELDLEAFRLRIGKHAMQFSPLLRSLFEQPHELQISASWYHDRKILPPYLSLKIRPRKKDFSYSILVNLDTLEIIQLSVVLQESKSVSRHLRVELSEQEREAIKASIETLK